MRNSLAKRVGGYLMLALALGQVALSLLSWIITAAMPETFPRSLLSPEGIRWFFGTFTDHLASPWLVWLLLVSIAWGTLRASGLLHFDPSVYRHRNALRLVCAEVAVFVAVILLLTISPHAILLNVMGGLASSSFSRSILPYLCLMVIVASLSYGVASDRMRSLDAVATSMAEGIRSLAPLFVIYILAVQLIYSILYLLG